jgi:hypothetical protein
VPSWAAGWPASSGACVRSAGLDTGNVRAGSTWLAALNIGAFGCFAGHPGLVLLGGQQVAHSLWARDADCGGLLPSGSGYVAGKDVVGVLAERDAGAVVTHGGPGIGVRGGLPGRPQ